MTAFVSPVYLRAELLRRRRSARLLVFTLGIPALIFLANAHGDHRFGGISIVPYFMVSMATYAAMNALLVNGSLISLERAVGWNRQLRLTGLTGRQYLATKTLVGYLTAVPGFLVVLGLGRARGVHLAAGHWLVLVASVLLALAPIAALGVLIGYLARPEAVQPLMGIGSVLLSFLGGLFAPLDGAPTWVRAVAEVFPTFWAGQAGRNALTGGWVGGKGVAILVAWTVGLSLLAARAYRRDGKRVV
jgi:ABC-2 type transport system permease protein